MTPPRRPAAKRKARVMVARWAGRHTAHRDCYMFTVPRRPGSLIRIIEVPRVRRKK